MRFAVEAYMRWLESKNAELKEAIKDALIYLDAPSKKNISYAIDTLRAAALVADESEG